MSSNVIQMSSNCLINVRLKCALEFGIKWWESAKLVWPISMMYLNFSCGWPGGWVGGWVGGWLDQMELRLNSAAVEVEVEVEAELGNMDKP